MEGRRNGSWERDRGVDGGNLACESVGIRKQETAGQRAQTQVLVLCINSHVL